MAVPFTEDVNKRTDLAQVVFANDYAGRSKHRIVLLVLALIALAGATGVQCAEPKRVLLLHSFGRDVAPYAAIASAFRSELARDGTAPLAVYEVSLDAVHATSASDDAMFVELLRNRFAGSTVDLGVWAAEGQVSVGVSEA